MESKSKVYIILVSVVLRVDTDTRFRKNCDNADGDQQSKQASPIFLANMLLSLLLKTFLPENEYSQRVRVSSLKLYNLQSSLSCCLQTS